jgi:hypothetical protein
VWFGVALATLVVWLVGQLPARPHSHREAVALLLERHGYSARAIYVGELQRPPRGACFLHECRERVAPVVVVREQRHVGRMVCHDDQSACELTLPALNIYNRALPDVAGARRFQRTFDEQVSFARAWVLSQIARLFDHKR